MEGGAVGAWSALRRGTLTLLAVATGLAAPSGAQVANDDPTLTFLHPSPARVAGYRLHVGSRSGVYFPVTNLARRPTVPWKAITVPLPFPLPPRGTPLYLALTAFDSQGRESIYSNETLAVNPGVRGADDGVSDDGDSSGRVGDRRCPTGVTRRCDDNCPTAPNGPEAGTCTAGVGYRIGRPCLLPRDCGPNGICSRAQEDRDRDGRGDACDVCVNTENPSQQDSDLDGFGNACDADYDNDGRVRIQDLNLVRATFGARVGDARFNPVFDSDNDGAIGISDVSFASSRLDTRPGPSFLACAGADDCTPGTCPQASGDYDGDGVGDECDVCVDVPDGRQIDTDLDGYGNACDADYNNDGRVDSLDLTLLNARLGAILGSDPRYRVNYDANDDGFIGALERALLFESWNGPPGPSGFACAGRAPCPR
jgi:hypothetical protein